MANRMLAEEKDNTVIDYYLCNVYDIAINEIQRINRVCVFTSMLVTSIKMLR